MRHRGRVAQYMTRQRERGQQGTQPVGPSRSYRTLVSFLVFHPETKGTTEGSYTVVLDWLCLVEHSLTFGV